MSFDFSDQAKKLIEEYDLDEEKIKNWRRQKVRTIAGKNILDYMVEQTEEDY